MNHFSISKRIQTKTKPNMQNPTQPHLSSNPEQIAFAAYSLWEQAGRPEGRDLEFWFQAERHLAPAATDSLSGNGHGPAGLPRTTSRNSIRSSTRVQTGDAEQTTKTPAARPGASRQRRTGTAGCGQ
jgi:hypothetical protein